ncbi:MAG: tetratricopeptide repeat protein [Balneolaceae bacterium]|nr:tetratricopeptide repeat protein [Balneolaceae bacterium]
MNNNSRDINLEKQIDAYIKGNLSEDEVDQLWVELLKNPEYIDLLETEIAVKRVFEERKRNEAQKPTTPISTLRKSWKWVAAAASVAILVIAINLLKVDSEQNLQGLALSDINIAENLASPDVLRNQKERLGDADSLLNIGFRAAVSGEISKALELYQEVIENYQNEPAAAQAYLNIGIIKYNSGDYEEASKAFNNALKKDTKEQLFKEKANWYLGNAYINLNRLEEARKVIHKTYTLDGIYRKAAFRLLRKIDYELGNVDFDNFDEQIKEGK